MLLAVIMGLIWFQLPHDEESIDDRRGLVGNLYKLKNAKKRNFGLNELAYNHRRRPVHLKLIS